LLKNRGTFLEIGGGRGFMLRYGRDNGFKEQIEIEPSGDAEAKFDAEGGNSRFIRGIFKKGMLPAGSVDMVCFFQILDHVPYPQEFLRDVYEVLAPGGVAISVTHNTKAVSAKLLGERSPIFDIEHTYLFNPGNLSRLFGQVGFSGVRTFSIANNYALRHWLHMAPVPGKKAILGLAEKAHLADVKVPLKAGNFAIIGQKRL
jgi:SAM-dependent methyltransferase